MAQETFIGNARIPVAVVTTENRRYHIVYCTDGSVWERDSDQNVWKELPPPLPGTTAHTLWKKRAPQ